MPPWTLPELEQCRKLVSPHVPKEDVQDAFDTVGRVARAAFNRTFMLSSKVEIERRAASITLPELIAKFVRHTKRRFIYVGDGDKLFHMWPADDEDADDRPYGAFEFAFASIYVRVLLCKEMDNSRSSPKDGTGRKKTTISLLYWCRSLC